MTILLPAGLSLLPVFLLLGGLVYLDSYRLVRLRTILGSVLCGCLAAGAALGLALLLRPWLVARPDFQYRWLAPVTEEILKAAGLVWLLQRRKIGFLVDGAIHGAAIGAGFAVLENLTYLWSTPDSGLLLWVIRGFGTGVMHAGTTALAAVIGSSARERSSAGKYLSGLLAGLLTAVLLHSLFNHFVLPPAWQTLAILAVIPPLVVLVYRRSERMLQEWLGAGLDTDLALLRAIRDGRFLETRAGRYLQSLRDRLPGEQLADLLCWLRVRTELSIKAKGLLLMRENGFDPPAGGRICELLAEWRFLERSVNRTGALILAPLQRGRSRDLWQLEMLVRQHTGAGKKQEDDKAAKHL